MRCNDVTNVFMQVVMHGGPMCFIHVCAVLYVYGCGSYSYGYLYVMCMGLFLCLCDVGFMLL